MLYLSRKIGESIIINNNIELKVMEVRGKSVKIGFEFPPEATVLRKEIHDKISEENRTAATIDLEEGSFFDLIGEVDLGGALDDVLGKPISPNASDKSGE